MHWNLQGKHTEVLQRFLVSVAEALQWKCDSTVSLFANLNLAKPHSDQKPSNH